MYTNQYSDTTFVCMQQCCLAYKFNEDRNFTHVWITLAFAALHWEEISATTPLFIYAHVSIQGGLGL